MRLNRRATRDQWTNPNNDLLPDGIGGTITGGPMEPIGLMQILERGTHGASHGGAVSGAAQVVAGGPGHATRAERGIALSDGSRICFASIADMGLFRNDDMPVARDVQTPLPGNASVPKGGKPRGTVGGRVHTSGPQRARVLASV
jgi:hypothetical protein